MFPYYCSYLHNLLSTDLFMGHIFSQPYFLARGGPNNPFASRNSSRRSGYLIQQWPHLSGLRIVPSHSNPNHYLCTDWPHCDWGSDYFVVVVCGMGYFLPAFQPRIAGRYDRPLIP
jgi:hypothetical protein